MRKFQRFGTHYKRSISFNHQEPLYAKAWFFIFPCWVNGASTGIGASVVFFPSIVKLASRRFLAGSLGFSAGVMCYVSFTEIFQKSLKAFEEAVGDQGQAFAFTTLTFFGGVALMLVSGE